jgi:hypothetical protein
MKVRKYSLATAGAAVLIAMSGFGPSSPAHASVQSCITGTSYTTNTRAAGWMPTDTGSIWMSAPGTISFNQTKTVSTSSTYSGSVAVTVSDVIVSATATFGVSYTVGSTITSSWTYSKPAPSGILGRMLILRASDKIGFTKVTDNSNCTNTTTSGLLLYAPRGADTNANTCMIMDLWPAKTNWSFTCVD